MSSGETHLFGKVDIPPFRAINDLDIHSLSGIGRDVGGDYHEGMGRGEVPDTAPCESALHACASFNTRLEVQD